MLHIVLDRKSTSPLTTQVYSAIKTKILFGTLDADSRLPSSRAFSQFLGVSRNVVLYAYDQLYAEGYIVTKEGSGSFVNHGLKLNSFALATVLKPKNLVGLRHEPDDTMIDLRTGVPDLSLFPIKKWGKLYQNICHTLAPLTLDYYTPGGCYALRYQLAQYLLRSRGVVCSAEQVFITTGAAQAFSLTARMLLNKQNHIVVEDPINNDILKIIRTTGASVHAVGVDDQGINPAHLPTDISPRLVFTTPSHQFPTGGVLSAARRIALIKYAQMHDGYILEDDYDSEYRFSGAPIASMQSLNPHRVIYTGTFSKKLYPALRIGYVVLPKALTKAFSLAKHLEDLHSPILEQLTLAEFIKTGLLEKHISKSLKVYRHKRATMAQALITAFSDNVTIKGNNTGIHLVAQFKDKRFTPATYHAFKKNGVRLYPIDTHAIQKGRYDDTLMIGYGNLTDEQIVEGVKRMHATIG